ncbi:polysaccharide deacetylase family protein [Candidatus Uabimicrobium amorphum]|uniref:Carbohydrate deacetylase n=1 Tax=Uabimicrobium amorphum TaxID=2596890 RepID=A0A5S9IS76_UABAM|nr:polysaccharide deacetylase family protein [Candidatus Uabimicrobium amorphum]BBM87178.1 carbohydrate deacetylase [Candidatus Uabimicrobium amorphum]
MKWFTLLLIVTSFIFAEEKTLVEELGYPKETRVLIVNADDFGMCHAQNLGTQRAFESQSITSATLMMTCPWVLEAIHYVKKNKITSVGVHITLNSEWKRYRWGPLKRKNETLIDKDGKLWRRSHEVELYANTEHIKNEVHAQIQYAVDLGISPTHFDSHMGSLYGIYTGRSELVAIAFSNAYEFGIPYRIPYLKALKPFRDMGFVMIDNLILDKAPDNEKRKQHYVDIINSLPYGVSELYIHPAVRNSELRRVTNSSRKRQADLDIFAEPWFKKAIKDNNIVLISYEPLRKLQRKKMKWRSGLKAQDVYEEYRKLIVTSRDLRTQWKEYIGSNMPAWIIFASDVFAIFYRLGWSPHNPDSVVTLLYIVGVFVVLFILCLLIQWICMFFHKPHKSLGKIKTTSRINLTIGLFGAVIALFFGIKLVIVPVCIAILSGLLGRRFIQNSVKKG